MIEVNVRLTCERFSYAGSPPTCSAQPLVFDHIPAADELARYLAAGGYVTDADGKHLCLRHAEAGERVIVTGEFQEIAPGVLVRMPGSWDMESIEVKRVTVDG